MRSQAADTAPPRVEVQLSDPAPYIQQGVMLTLRLLSDSNLAEANPELPSAGAIMVRSLGDPRASVRQVGARREIVTEFQFVVTPLESGDLTLPGLRVRGSHASGPGGLGRPFDVRSEPVRLNVRPAVAGAEPWLPLYHFAMRGQLTGDDRPMAGKPIGLTVEIVAVGATGGQLPSAEASLREATEFSVYLEGTDLEGATPATFSPLAREGWRYRENLIYLWNTAQSYQEGRICQVNNTRVTARKKSPIMV